MTTKIKLLKHYSEKIIAERRMKVAVTNFTKVSEKTWLVKLKSYLKANILHFCAVTSLHGYNHTINKKYSVFER